MNNPRALALVKGNREPHEAKKKSFDLGGNRTHDLRIRSTVTLPIALRGRTEKVGDVAQHSYLKRVLQHLTSDHSLVAIYRDKNVHREVMELLNIIYLLLSASYTPWGWGAYELICIPSSFELSFILPYFLMDLLH